MKRTVILGMLLISMFCTACYHSNTDSTDIVKVTPNRKILFDFGNVMGVNPAISVCTYDDGDAFDYDYMAYACNLQDWYGDFIYVDIDSTLAKDFACDYEIYNSTDDFEIQEKLNDKWVLVENFILYKNETGMFYYRLRKSM